MTIYTIVQKNNDLLGLDLWRDANSAIPLLYRPTLSHVSRANATGTNINQTIDSIVPVIRLVDGLAVSTDAFKATFKFSALQHIVETELREQCFDAMLAYLTTNRTAIINGSKTSSTADWTLV